MGGNIVGMEVARAHAQEFKWALGSKRGRTMFRGGVGGGGVGGGCGGVFSPDADGDDDAGLAVPALPLVAEIENIEQDCLLFLQTDMRLLKLTLATRAVSTTAAQSIPLRTSADRIQSVVPVSERVFPVWQFIANVDAAAALVVRTRPARVRTRPPRTTAASSNTTTALSSTTGTLPPFALPSLGVTHMPPLDRLHALIHTPSPTKRNAHSSAMNPQIQLNLILHPLIESLIEINPVSEILRNEQAKLVNDIYSLLLDFLTLRLAKSPTRAQSASSGNLFASRVANLIAILMSDSVSRFDLASQVLLRFSNDGEKFSKVFNFLPFRTLVREYCRLGKIDDAMKVAKSAKLVHPEIYRPIIQSYKSPAEFEFTIKLFETLLNHTPNPKIIPTSLYNHIIYLCNNANTQSSIKSAENTLNVLFKLSKPNANTFALILWYAESLQAIDSIISDIESEPKYRYILKSETVQKAILKAVRHITYLSFERTAATTSTTVENVQKDILQKSLEYMTRISNRHSQQQQKQTHAYRNKIKIPTVVTRAAATRIAAIYLGLHDFANVFRSLEPYIHAPDSLGDCEQVLRFLSRAVIPALTARAVATRDSGEPAIRHVAFLWRAIEMYSDFRQHSCASFEVTLSPLPSRPLVLPRYRQAATRLFLCNAVEALGVYGQANTVKAVFEALVAHTGGDDAGVVAGNAVEKNGNVLSPLSLSSYVSQGQWNLILQNIGPNGIKDSKLVASFLMAAVSFESPDAITFASKVVDKYILERKSDETKDGARDAIAELFEVLIKIGGRRRRHDADERGDGVGVKNWQTPVIKTAIGVVAETAKRQLLESESNFVGELEAILNSM
ncbi:hypothetical protein HK100_011258 [Physocladia obscura]|uniref:Uncharacterized protein n=1 Tax=Physocladia obscura TaxID=109957 RepID=A0AAD5XIF6_9FUNG|nr:hypothetical protein HK100_011258 [Physocladia obscura]